MQSKHIGIPLSLQNQNRTMNPPVDIRHIHGQVLPEVFVCISYFHISLSGSCLAYLPAKHLNNWLLQTVIGRVYLALQCDVVQYLLVKQRLKIFEGAAGQQRNGCNLWIAGSNDRRSE